MVATTPQYIGLRTNRYSPLTTRCLVGRMGAGVPRPWTANRRNESSNPTAPAASRTNPAARTSGEPGSGARVCQRVIHHGTSPATVPGATTRKTAEPMTATALLLVAFAATLGGYWP